jgi:hypothetical protein
MRELGDEAAHLSPVGHEIAADTGLFRDFTISQLANWAATQGRMPTIAWLALKPARRVIG